MVLVRCISVFAGAALIIACATTYNPHHEYDASAPFADYQTYAWVTESPLVRAEAGVGTRDPRISPMLDGWVREAVDRNMRAKGYEKLTRPERADLILSFSIGARDKIQVDSYPSRAGYRYGPYGGYGGWHSDVRTYTEGILAIDFFDRNTREAIWHGWGTKRMSANPDQEKRRKTINGAVDAILAPFPYRSTVQ